MTQPRITLTLTLTLALALTLTLTLSLSLTLTLTLTLNLSLTRPEQVRAEVCFGQRAGGAHFSRMCLPKAPQP